MGYSPSPFREVNSHGLHAIRSHPFIIILHNTCMQKTTIWYITALVKKKCRCTIPHKQFSTDWMEFMNFLRTNGKLISPLDRFPALGGQRTCMEHFDSSKILEVVAQGGFMDKM